MTDQPYIETPENWETKTLCVLVVDVSGSMHGEPIRQLNEGLQRFHQDILARADLASQVELAIVTFGESVHTILEPALADNFIMPTLTASERYTQLAAGVREAMALVDKRKRWYKSTNQPYHRPWIVLISDGKPNPPKGMDALPKDIREQVEDKHFIFLALGVLNADMDTLQVISHSDWPPKELEGLHFSQFFLFLSHSIRVGTLEEDEENLTLKDMEEQFEQDDSEFLGVFNFG